MTKSNDLSKCLWWTAMAAVFTVGAVLWPPAKTELVPTVTEPSVNFSELPAITPPDVVKSLGDNEDPDTMSLETLLKKSSKINGTVTRILDGDTLVIARNNGEEVKVRLAGIDAPEITQDFGEQARTALDTLVLNRRVTVENKGTDPYNRVIGVITVDDEDINQKLVKDGDAWFYPDYANGLDYAADQAEADKGKLGLWSNRGAVPPWLYRKLTSTGTFGKAVMSGGFYLDSQGTLHNSRCVITPRYRWDGVGKHPNCPKCGGVIFD